MNTLNFNRPKYGVVVDPDMVRVIFAPILHHLQEVFKNYEAGSFRWDV